MAKRYYWLKLKHDFFSQTIIKKLRKIAGGDTYTIIYLKLQLLSLKNNGKLYFEGIEDDFSKELALTLDEDAENVQVTLLFLKKYGLIEEVKEDEFLLPETVENIGSETQAAVRVRRHRQNQKNEQKALQCNTNVTNCNTEREKETEKDIELDKERETKEKNLSLGTTEILNFIQEKACISLTSQYQNISGMVETYEIKDIKEAISKSLSKGKKGVAILNYATGILKNWAVEGKGNDNGANITNTTEDNSESPYDLKKLDGEK